MPSISDNVRVAGDLCMYGQTFLLSPTATGSAAFRRDVGLLRRHNSQGAWHMRVTFDTAGVGVNWRLNGEFGSLRDRRFTLLKRDRLFISVVARFVEYERPRRVVCGPPGFRIEIADC